MAAHDLFGNPVPPKGRQPVGPAAPAAEAAAAARAVPASVRLGTSSWSFPGWAGIVYDHEAPQAQLARQGLAAYAKHPLLRAVGIDRTFYAPISATAFAEYAVAVPDDFRFLVKAASLCTAPGLRSADGSYLPNERYLDPAFAAEHVVGPMVEGLGPKAGPLVFQFPPQGGAIARDPERFAERLGRFLDALPRGPLYAVELRDRELFGPAYFEALDAVGVRHCLCVHPRMPSVADQWALARAAREGPIVVRWMLGGNQEYEAARNRYSPFDRLVDEDPTSRGSIADLCLDHARRGLESFVIANNKAEGSAPRTVFKLAERIVRGDVPQTGVSETVD